MHIQATKFFKTFLCGLAIAAAGHASAQVAHLTLHSEPGDYIGQGNDYDITYTPSNSIFFSTEIRRSLGSGAPTDLLFVLGSGPSTPFALLFFGTHGLGIPMQPGFYANAERADFASLSHPGLDIGFDHRGSNTLTGNFTVTNFSYSPTLGIQSFAASFEQHSEGALPALFGTFTYQAVTTAVPEPESFAMLFVGLGLMGAVVRRRKMNRV